MPDIQIEDLARRQDLTLRINGPNPTFRLDTEAIEAAAVRELDPVSKDFLEIAAAVFHADGELGRGGDTRPDLGRGWHRNLRFTVPVRLPDLWNRPDLVRALTDTVRFLTDDQVEFRFTPRPGGEVSTGFLNLDPKGATFSADEVIMLSGGLDSFAGALESLATNNGKVLLVSHRSAPKVNARQARLAAWLETRFPGRIRHVRVNATRAGTESNESTQRSRSLLFAAIGHAAALSFGTRQLSFYENGIVSLNLPISPQVVGTMATRTTHPQSIALLNRLLGLISPGGTRLSNGYQWLTKTEVVERIDRYNGTAMIGTAVSCTHVRDQTRLHTHCGRCSQCLDRRFAILEAGLERHDPDLSYETDVFTGPRPESHSRTLAVEWSRHGMRLHGISESDFLQDFASDLSRVLHGFSPEERDDVSRRVIELHRRHGGIVRRVLTKAIAERSVEIAELRLDPTCLLKLWISNVAGAALDLQVAARQPASARVDARFVPEVDYVPTRDGPWIARFFSESEVPVVAIQGLGRVRGMPAKVSHLLKEVLLEDRDTGLPEQESRFVLVYRLPGSTFSKDAVKQNVFRCRRTLAAAYSDIFGSAPATDLLIESAGRRGHRLNPRTTIIESDDSVDLR